MPKLLLNSVRSRLNAQSIQKLLSCLGAGEMTVSDSWVNSSCPLAPHSHENGRDRHPSFGVSINEKGESLYRCFTCTDSAPLSGLIHNLWVLDISGWEEAMQVYGEQEFFSNTDKISVPASRWGSTEKKRVPKIEVPESILNKFPLLQEASGFEQKRCMSFLHKERGIRPSVQDLFSLRYSDNDRLVVFPRLDKEHKVWWLRARSRVAKAFFSVSHTYVENKWGEVAVWGDSSYFFGGQFLTKEPVIIVESETDVLRLYSLGITNVVATGGGVQQAQLDRLYHNVVILAFDADIPGLKNRIKAEKYFKGYSTLFALDWGAVGIKDAGELESIADFDRVYNRKILL